MSKQQWTLDDYVEVADRIRAWHERHPEGRIESDIVSMSDKLVVTKSRVFRTADPSERPAGEGYSTLGIPGKTPYTKDSELENCETSSVGRALVMAGVPAKRIASTNEIRSKRGDNDPDTTSHEFAPKPAAATISNMTPKADPPPKYATNVGELKAYIHKTIGVATKEDADLVIYHASSGTIRTLAVLTSDPEAETVASAMLETLKLLLKKSTPAEFLAAARGGNNGSL